MVKTPPKTIVTTTEPQFSFLTCLFAAGCILLLETLIDIDAYDDFWGHRSKIFLFFMHTNDYVLKFLHLSRFYNLAMEDWMPVLVCSLVFGYRLGGRGIVYSLCGLLLFLIFIHNFRGFGVRENVFEEADAIRRWHSSGDDLQIPDPLFFDKAYFVMATAGSILGAVLRYALRQPEPPGWNVSRTALLWVGYACILLGVIESILIILFVQPRDIYLNLPITYGYALTAFGLITVLIVQYRERLSYFLNFEIV